MGKLRSFSDTAIFALLVPLMDTIGALADINYAGYAAFAVIDYNGKSLSNSLES